MKNYLFKAKFEDGTIFQQSIEDLSPREGKSDFGRLLEEKKRIVLFQLNSEEHIYSVDLTDGHFERDGVREEPTEPFDEKTARVVYFRNCEQEVSTPATYRRPISGKLMVDEKIMIVSEDGKSHIHEKGSRAEFFLQEYPNPDGSVDYIPKLNVYPPIKESEIVGYVLGWQCTIKGKNYQQTIIIE